MMGKKVKYSLLGRELSSKRGSSTGTNIHHFRALSANRKGQNREGKRTFLPQEQIHKTLQHDLVVMGDLNAKIHTDKTKLMSNRTMKTKVCDEELKEVQDFKYLSSYLSTNSNIKRDLH